MQSYPIIPKELSWLAFNERVLQEAQDETVPPLERLRFLGIFSNNLDEFYRVHVADVRRRMEFSGSSDERAQHIQLLQQIQVRVIALQRQFERTRQQVVAALAKKHVHFVSHLELSDSDKKWLGQYFLEHIKADIVPIFIRHDQNIVNAIDDDSPYLCVQLKTGEQAQYALIELPTKVHSRFLLMPVEGSKRKKKVILLEHIIQLCLADLFRGMLQFDSAQAWSMKLTRNADFSVSDEIDQSLMEQLEEALKQRDQAEPVRFVYDEQMPPDMVELLTQKLGLTSYDSIVPSGPFRNYKDFIKFPHIGRKSLNYAPLKPLQHPQFTQHPSVFSAISHGDILLYYPYHHFSQFTEFVRQSAYDPQVTHIRISIYRVAAQSRIIASLLDAARNGKHVTVVVELRARFDEEANIEWSRILTDAGIEVSFGIPNLKIHSKICLVQRKEQTESVNYVAIGTGNFHEQTAKVYTDFMLFSRHPELSQEVERVFQFIKHSYRPPHFSYLLVSPLNTRERILRHIDQEIANAKAGDKAWIKMKVNNLVDERVIEQLYEASRAGVKIHLIVRGMCSLQAGVAPFSEQIEVISIVDRFLEHPRVYAFANAGEPLVYIGSADLMRRNLDTRVEVCTPLLSPQLQRTVLDIFALQWADNTKARILDAAQTNRYRKRGNKKKTQAQVAIYYYLQKATE